ncbi:hypothetical protein K440DRAFT_66511 [Wilcoxina mikolae CBS 423.85]|nr:hypothetical protein K440DRAFT_66511 [Wilcoxina mikolae CBS 423.85]
MIAEMAWPKRLIFSNDNNDTWTGAASFPQTSITGTQAHQRAKGLTTLAAIRWESSTPQSHCFYQGEDLSIVDLRWDDGDRRWIEVPMASDVESMADKGDFSAAIKDNNITVYYRATDGVREMEWTKSSDWTSGSGNVLVPGS